MIGNLDVLNYEVNLSFQKSFRQLLKKTHFFLGKAHCHSPQMVCTSLFPVSSIFVRFCQIDQWELRIWENWPITGWTYFVSNMSITPSRFSDNTINYTAQESWINVLDLLGVAKNTQIDGLSRVNGSPTWASNPNWNSFSKKLNITIRVKHFLFLRWLGWIASSKNLGGLKFSQ